MKKRTYLKQGAFQKVDNTKGNRIKGALDLNKEVLDTLVDKSLASTLDCCNYFNRISTVLENQYSEEQLLSLPVGTIFIPVDADGNVTDNLNIVLQLGGEKGIATITINF